MSLNKKELDMLCHLRDALAERQGFPICQSSSSARHYIASDFVHIIDVALVGEVAAFLLRNKIALDILLLAVHLRVVALLTSSDSILVGVYDDITGKNSTEISLVPFLVELSESESWLCLLARIKYQYTEFRRSFMTTNRQNEITDIQTMIDTMFLFPMHSQKPADVRVEELQVRAYKFTFREQMAKFTLQLDFRYNESMLNVDDMTRIAKYYQSALSQISADASQCYLRASLLGSEEIEWLSTHGSGPQIELPSGTALNSIFAMADCQPHKKVLQDANNSISYVDLLNGIASICCHFPSGRQRIIGVIMPRSVEWIVCMTAIMSNNDIYVPLDPEDPDIRLLELIQEAGISIIICSPPLHSRMASLLDSFTPSVKLIEYSLQSGLFNLVRPTQPTAEATSLSYILFTSGSTGKPKGAQIEHRGMYNHLQAKIELLELTEKDVIAQTAPQTFDVSIWQAITGLLVGATTVVYSKDVQIIPALFLRNIIDDRITLLELVPSYFSLFVSYLERVKNKYTFTSLRAIVVTGEALKQELANRWFALYPAIPIVNAYGPTEASDDITHYILTDVGSDNIVPIGKPIRNLRVHILDRHDNPCPIGVVGEICVTGIGVGTGYINAPDKTRQSFSFSHPLAKWSTGRMYRTGDLGYWKKDGNLAFVGRKDFQVKIRGMRAELGEIENVILNVSEIDDVVVLLDQKDTNDAFLIAFLLGKTDLSSLRQKLTERLPSYMLPNQLICLESFPLNRAGKVDKKALLKMITPTLY
ncbi:amino acid adenylation domain-containing protein [Chitiniphilus purpureus]|uniref:Amino acid adenylation domain-containing protein n=1 Tax=Chitiniphilus purpureus TaxID=2981137 RepID=A0ABY6DQ40_9NEIS|nr:amino acid adenylation domain-containing protein [Chitiniphilus sp. CD1]UXY15818.1 amino acid adenylation domain-containing protein [Chitiniphilus sp. CD1]